MDFIPNPTAFALASWNDRRFAASDKRNVTLIHIFSDRLKF